MKTITNYWTAPLLAAKARAKETGQIKGDADLAAAVSELLDNEGLGGGGRAWINHFLTGKRIPSIVEFLAMCQVLKLNPSSALALEQNDTTKADLSANKTIAQITPHRPQASPREDQEIIDALALRQISQEARDIIITIIKSQPLKVDKKRGAQ